MRRLQQQALLRWFAHNCWLQRRLMNGQTGTHDAAKTLSVVGLGGSLRLTSSSRAALKVALDGAAEAGAKTELLDLRQLNLPMYDPSSDDVFESVTHLVESLYAADAMIWSSP